MLRLTKKADYGLMALKYLAEQPGISSAAGATSAVAQSAKDIAQAYHIPPPLLAKILQTLARAGLLVSHAGTNGGYALARPASKISAFEVIRVIDGPLFITNCVTIHGSCDLAGHCTIKEPLRKVDFYVFGGFVIGVAAARRCYRVRSADRRDRLKLSGVRRCVPARRKSDPPTATILIATTASVATGLANVPTCPRRAGVLIQGSLTILGQAIEGLVRHLMPDLATRVIAP